MFGFHVKVRGSRWFDTVCSFFLLRRWNDFCMILPSTTETTCDWMMVHVQNYQVKGWKESPSKYSTYPSNSLKVGERFVETLSIERMPRMVGVMPATRWGGSLYIGSMHFEYICLHWEYIYVYMGYDVGNMYITCYTTHGWFGQSMHWGLQLLTSMRFEPVHFFRFLGCEDGRKSLQQMNMASWKINENHLIFNRRYIFLNMFFLHCHVSFSGILGDFGCVWLEAQWLVAGV